MATAAALPTLVPVLLRGYVNSDVVPSIPFVQMNKIIPVVLRFSSAKLLLVTTRNCMMYTVPVTAALLPTLVPALLRGSVPSDVVTSIPFD